jgi:hypothetical protein
MSNDLGAAPRSAGDEENTQNPTGLETVAKAPIAEAAAESTLDERFKYGIRFIAAGHRHDDSFFSLDEAQEFAAKYVVAHGLGIRDLQIIDSLSNVRTWQSISKKTLKLSNLGWISARPAPSSSPDIWNLSAASISTWSKSGKTEGSSSSTRRRIGPPDIAWSATSTTCCASS